MGILNELTVLFKQYKGYDLKNSHRPFLCKFLRSLAEPVGMVKIFLEHREI